MGPDAGERPWGPASAPARGASSERRQEIFGRAGNPRESLEHLAGEGRQRQVALASELDEQGVVRRDPSLECPPQRAPTEFVDGYALDLEAADRLVAHEGLLPGNCARANRQPDGVRQLGLASSAFSSRRSRASCPIERTLNAEAAR